MSRFYIFLIMLVESSTFIDDQLLESTLPFIE